MKTLLKKNQLQFLTKNIYKTFSAAAAPKEQAKSDSNISRRFHDVYLQEMQKLQNNT
jgi:hypothetical protein